MVKENSEQAVEVAQAEPVAEPTEEQLRAELQTALDSGDFKAVASVSGKLVKFQKAREDAEKTAKQAKLAGVTDKAKTAIQAALKKLYESGELDEADGVWFSWDFGDANLVACRLTKTATRAARKDGSGGGGKKFDVNTNDLLEKYGADEYKDGASFQQAWDSNTDKNWRYAIRQALLKKDGVIS